MKKIASFLAACAAAFTVSSCGNQQAFTLPGINGAAGEVVVVMSENNWNGELGAKVKEILGADCPYLPQPEPLYKLVNVKPEGFGDLFMRHRNLILFDLAETNTQNNVEFLKNAWAAPQCVIKVHASCADSAAAAFGREQQMVLASLEQAERDRVIADTKLYESEEFKEDLSQFMGGNIHVPASYGYLAKPKGDFRAIGCRSKMNDHTIFQGILIWKYPAPANYDFSLNDLVIRRNAFVGANIEGQTEGSFMTTAECVPQLTFGRYKGIHFAELRGLWEMDGDFMGGPFVSHSFYSKDGKDIITIEAFVYAAGCDKRNLLRQVESMLFSFEWNKEPEAKKE